MLDRWNDIGYKLIAMAQDFPEDKYDFKVQKDERTFALNLLHAAALDFVLIRRISGSNVGPDFGEGDNPSRDVFKTKADVVKFVQEAVADGAKVIQQQGDAGLDKTTKFFGNRMAHNSSIWTFAIEHSGEHYGQLVVYYRANNLVPPSALAITMIPPLMGCPYAHRHQYRSCGGRSVESERRREVPVSVDLRLQIGDLLLRGGNGIGAGDKAARRWLLARNDDERSRELRRVAGLLAILAFPKLELLRSALVVVLDGRLGVVRRLLREELRAEEPWVDDGSGDAERRDLLVNVFHR